MEEVRYIQVLLPLRLEWEPFYLVPQEMELAPGDRVRVEFASKPYVGVVTAVDVTPPEDLVPRILYVIRREKELPPVSAQEIRFLRAIADYYLCTPGEVYKAALVRDLTPKGNPRRRKAAEPRAITLSPLQEDAAGKILEAFGAGKTALLHGVTGSGKTEVYLHLARKILEEGKNVLLLVPEIALSRQLEERISAAFGDLLVYHSAQTPSRRAQVAATIRCGSPYVVLGTRSALFLPHRNLGLVVVDEEHDNSFKQDSPAPRYHAREGAIMLGAVQGAGVLLGSATPSLESLYNCRVGRFVKVTLPRRFHAGAQASLEIVDTVAERRKNGMVGSLSRKLLAHLDRTLKEGGQAVLLRSRRSYAPSVQCEDCGEIVRCPHCNVSLSLHKGPDRLLCHYCGHSEPFTGICGRCGGHLKPLGAGTQKIEEELQAIFPAARIARLDSDTAGEAEVIRAFENRETDILIGTQVVTKGFDFAGLSLVAVIQADNILGQQDFRADEHAVQLLEQFRGRSGRRGEPGLLLIQTREPGHPVFSRLGEGRDLSEEMLLERSRFGYPPYTRLIHLTLRDKSENRLSFLARRLAAALPVPAVGPYTPVVDKVADNYIRQIRISLPRDKELIGRKRAVWEAVCRFEKENKYFSHITVDVDPV